MSMTVLPRTMLNLLKPAAVLVVVLFASNQAYA